MIFGVHARPPDFAHATAFFGGTAQQVADAFGKGAAVFRRRQQAGLPVLHEIADAFEAKMGTLAEAFA